MNFLVGVELRPSKSPVFDIDLKISSNVRELRPRLRNQVQRLTKPEIKHQKKVKKEFKCGHCEEVFLKKDQKMIHECVNHQPILQLYKIKDVTAHKIDNACQEMSMLLETSFGDNAINGRKDLNMTNENIESMILSNSMCNEKDESSIPMSIPSPNRPVIDFNNEAATLSKKRNAEFRPNIFNGLLQGDLQRNNAIRTETSESGVNWDQAFNKIERQIEKQSRPQISQSIQIPIYQQIFSTYQYHPPSLLSCPILNHPPIVAIPLSNQFGSFQGPSFIKSDPEFNQSIDLQSNLEAEVQPEMEMETKSESQSERNSENDEIDFDNPNLPNQEYESLSMSERFLDGLNGIVSSGVSNAPDENEFRVKLEPDTSNSWL